MPDDKREEFNEFIKEEEGEAMVKYYGFSSFRDGPEQIREALDASRLEEKLTNLFKSGVWKTIGVRGLEGPHNNIHMDMGGWMTSTATAAFDPIFWMHHCNVERWLCKWQIKNNAKTVSAIDEISGSDEVSPHKIPWDMKFTEDEIDLSHAESFSGSMKETVWYDFVKYDEFEVKKLEKLEFALMASARPLAANRVPRIVPAHSIAVKVNRKKIIGSFMVKVHFLKDTEEIALSKFGVFQRGGNCGTCKANKVITVSGPVPKEVTFPCAIHVELVDRFQKPISVEEAPRSFNIRLLIEDTNDGLTQ